MVSGHRGGIRFSEVVLSEIRESWVTHPYFACRTTGSSKVLKIWPLLYCKYLFSDGVRRQRLPSLFYE